MRPSDPQTSTEALSDPTIQCATIEQCGVALVRVVGRGTFLNSVPVSQFADYLQNQEERRWRFVVDLSECPTMDSTFMGTLAKITLRQTQQLGTKLAVCNANEHNRRLLKTLGLSHVMDLRQKTPEELKRQPVDLRPAETIPVTRLDRILHMIECHEKLIDLDTENEVRFSNVLKYLRQSLDEEKKSGEGGEEEAAP